MPADARLDPHAILAALGVANVADVAPVAGGADTALWRVEHGGLVSALRVFRASQGDVCQRELAAMEVAAGAGLPVPRVRAAGEWQARPALLLGWCAGVPMRDALLRAPWRVWPLGVAFGRMQARLHGVAAPQLRGWPGGDWIAWAGVDEAALQARLRQGAGEAAALLHLDFHPLNVLADGRRVTAILDWANARAGDPRADVARTYTILVVEPNGPGREPRLLTLARRAFARAWRRGYEQAAGRLVGMAPFYQWAGAVMVRDLAPRVADPASWWEARHLDAIRCWTDQWREPSSQAP